MNIRTLYKVSTTVLISFAISLYTIFVIAAPSVSGVDAEHPYFLLSTTYDGKTSVFIGADGAFVPAQFKDRVLIRVLLRQNITSDDTLKGQESELVMLGSCQRKVAKVAEIWQRDSENAKGESRFPDLTEDKKVEAIVELVLNSPDIPIERGSLLGDVLVAACNFVRTPVPKPPKPPKPKPKYIEI